jgi:FHA domain/Cyclin-dependent kinase inhibitor 3 (CDKN3)
MYRVYTSESDPFHVDFLPDDEVNLPGRIGLAGTPGRKDPRAPEGPQNRELASDLERLVHRYRAERLVTLLERGEYVRDEMDELCVPDLLVHAKRAGLSSDWTPLPDGDVPVSLDTLFMLVERILAEARDGRIVVIHCRDGLGRTALVAGCCLVALGASVGEALEVIDEVRPGTTQSAAQLQTMRAFDELWRKRALERSNPTAISDLLDLNEGNASGPWRISQTGLVPLSQAGAAALVYVGVDEDALNAGLKDGSPLREGDVFHVVPGKVLWLGRGGECDVCIASSQLSRVHAVVAFVPVAEGQLVLADLDSRNGTWVGDEQTSVSFLGLGDEFTLARAFRFRYDGLG